MDKKTICGVSFTSERIISGFGSSNASILQSSWCPSMDLLAFLTSENRVSIYRYLNFQKLWDLTSNEPSKATKICWSPDGKIIVMGHEDGCLCFFNIENGEKYFSSKFHESEITSLHWSQNENANPNENTEYSKENRLFSAYNILACSDNKGNISLSAFGIYCFLKLNIQETFPHIFNPVIQSLSISPTLTEMGILVKGTNVYSQQEEIFWIRFDVNIIWEMRKEIQFIASHFYQINLLKEQIKKTLQELVEKWNDIKNTFNEKLSLLQDLLQKEGIMWALKCELTQLLIFGNISPAVSQFLLNTLNEQALKKLKKNIDLGFTEIQKLSHENLKEPAEKLFFRIGLLLNSAKWNSSFESMGILESTLQDLVTFSGRSVARIEGFILETSNLKLDYEMFLLWLSKVQSIESKAPVRTQEKLDQVKVSQFIYSDFSSNVLDQYFLEDDLTIHFSANQEENMYRFRPINYSFFQVFNNLFKSIENMFHSPIQYFSNVLQNNNPLCFGIGQSQQIFFPQISYHLIKKAYEGILLFVEVVSSSLWIVNWNHLQETKAITLELALTEEVLNISPYKPNLIGLISNKTDSKQQILKFFSLENLNFLDVSDSLNSEVLLIEAQKLEKTSIQPSKWYIHQNQNCKLLSFSLSSSRGTVCLQLEKFHILLLDAEEEGNEAEESNQMEEDLEEEKNQKEEVED